MRIIDCRVSFFHFCATKIIFHKMFWQAEMFASILVIRSPKCSPAYCFLKYRRVGESYTEHGKHSSEYNDDDDEVK